MPPRLPDAVEHVPLGRLIPYARNARTHDDDQVAKIAASIVEFGWLNPVLIDDAGNVIAGHGRLLAAQSQWKSRTKIDREPVVPQDSMAVWAPNRGRDRPRKNPPRLSHALR